MCQHIASYYFACTSSLSMLLRFMRVCHSILNMIMTWMVFHFLSILLWKEVDEYLCGCKASSKKTRSKFKPKHDVIFLNNIIYFLCTEFELISYIFTKIAMKYVVKLWLKISIIFRTMTNGKYCSFKRRCNAMNNVVHT